jgi:cytochrome c oxidase subunit 2
MNLSILFISFLLNFNFLNITQLDYARPWQLGFQDAASPIMEGIISFHHDVMFLMIIIMTFVLWMLLRILVLFSAQNNPNPEHFTNHTVLEIVWTIIPSIILIFIAIPSFALLYAMDEIVDPAMTIKVNGHQWYWSYEYSDYKIRAEGDSGDSSEFDSNDSIAFDAYLVPEDELEKGELRLLEVDNRVLVPTDTHVRVLVTSSDVLHSWAVPALGVKVDACPGRLNQTSFFAKREGVFFGQCSELCGVNHGFMPIVVEAVSLSDFMNMMKEVYKDA